MGLQKTVFDFAVGKAVCRVPRDFEGDCVFSLDKMSAKIKLVMDDLEVVGVEFGSPPDQEGVANDNLKGTFFY